MAGAITRDWAFSINVVAISRSSRYCGLISQAVDAPGLLYFEQLEMLAVRKRRLGHTVV
jgi:hypothetical protein